MASVTGEQVALSPRAIDLGTVPGITTWSASFSDADEQAACVWPLYPQKYDQLGCGGFDGRCATVDLGGVFVVRESVNQKMHQTGIVTAASLGWAWKRSNRYRSNGFEHDDDCMMFFGANEEFDIFCDPCEMVGVTVSEDALSAWFGQPADTIEPNLFRSVRKVPPSLTEALRKNIAAVLSTVDGQYLVADQLWRDTVLNNLLHSVIRIAELSGSADRSRRCERTYERVVKAAHECVTQRASEELTLQSLCDQIGVSNRNLHYAFEALVGMSPGQYLRCVRLNAVRRDIKRWAQADFTLADIACRWGFWHPSHFAADYKRRFGELPSQTGQRAKLERGATS